MTEFEGQHVLVLGLGVSGISAARFLAERGARVVAADERAPDAIGDLSALPAEVDVHVGAPFPELDAFDLVVPSPGVPAARYAHARPPVRGDIELCFRALEVPIIAVTGTNGKSTVVRLIEAMAQAAGLRARAAGNLGLPALELVGEPLDLAVLEVSSFQLESVSDFAPRVGVLLNVSPDHLDRHGDFAGYTAAKARLFARQADGDTAVLNADDDACAALELAPQVERLTFGRRGPFEQGAWRDGPDLVLRRAGQTRRFSLDDAPGLAGQTDNVLAALLALAPLGVDLARAASALATFQGLPHRFQTVATRRGVRFVDDSKATNIGAAARSLANGDGPVLWIAGGRHKGGTLDALVEAAAPRVRRALLIGEAAAEFEAALAGQVACEIVGDLEKAVTRSAALANPGDIVLLAPACASFDQFDSFEARGRAFRDAVERLVEQPSAPAERIR